MKRKKSSRGVYCPYCGRVFSNKKAVYSHWGHCEEYKKFLATHERDERLPFVFRGSPYVPDFGPGRNPNA